MHDPYCISKDKIVKSVIDMLTEEEKLSMSYVGAIAYPVKDFR